MSSSYLELEGFILTKKVGQGAFGKVYKGYEKGNEDAKVAVKIMARADNDDLEKEVQFLKDLDHPGIVKLVSYGFGKKMFKQPGGKH